MNLTEQVIRTFTCTQTISLALRDFGGDYPIQPYLMIISLQLKPFNILPALKWPILVYIPFVQLYI